jgi:hypothetical protein
MVIEFVLRYLSSQRGRDLADASYLGAVARLTPQSAASMRVPVPDEPMLFALRVLTHAKHVAARWGEEVNELLDSLFDEDSIVESRQRVLQTSRSLRLRVTAAEMSEDLSQQVRSTYPLPIASRWRLANAAMSAGPSHEGYRALLETAEVLACPPSTSTRRTVTTSL